MGWANGTNWADGVAHCFLADAMYRVHTVLVGGCSVKCSLKVGHKTFEVYFLGESLRGIKNKH